MAKRGTEAPYKGAKILNPFKVECGERLRLVRQALGYTEVEPFAEQVDEKRMNIYTWETGVALVPVWFVIKLRKRFEVGFNWIYAGDMNDMPVPVRRSLMIVKARLAAGLSAGDESDESWRHAATFGTGDPGDSKRKKQ